MRRAMRWAAARSAGATTPPMPRKSESAARTGLPAALQAAGVPAAALQRPAERIDGDPDTAAFGLWPTVTHAKMGKVRVDGMPVHFSETDWEIRRGGPCCGEHTDRVLTELLGMKSDDLARLHEEGVL